MGEPSALHDRANELMRERDPRIRTIETAIRKMESRVGFMTKEEEAAVALAALAEADIFVGRLERIKRSTARLFATAGCPCTASPAQRKETRVSESLEQFVLDRGYALVEPEELERLRGIKARAEEKLAHEESFNYRARDPHVVRLLRSILAPSTPERSGETEPK